MIKNDEKFIKYIEELKCYNLKAVKLELESSYLPENLCLEISNTLKQNSLPLALKLGGFSSYNDILISKNIDAKIIIAPMIETPYALKKFIETLFCAYSNNLENKEIYINIETVFAIKNFNEITVSKYFKHIDGIIIGRGDLISSLDIEPTFINSVEIKKIIEPVMEQCKKENKKIILGGKITPKSIDFLNLFERGTFYGFETRMALFKAEELSPASMNNAIKNAIEFEIYYLKLLEKISKDKNNILKRISALQNRIN